MSMEIALLFELVPISLDEIEMGSQCLLISRGDRRGLLLPRVAVDHRFSAEQFLAETCRKAQFPPDAWRDPDANLFWFTCEGFSSDARNLVCADSPNTHPPSKKPRGHFPR